MNNANTKTTAQFTIADLEQQISDLEGIRVVFRVPRKTKLCGVTYAETFQKAYKGNNNIQAFKSRITRVLNGLEVVETRKGVVSHVNQIEYDIIDGRGVTPNYRTLMSTLRASYSYAA